MQYQLRLVILWVPIVYFSDIVRFNCLTTLQRMIPDDWMLRYTLCNSADYKETIEDNMCIVTIVKLICPFEFYHDGPGATDP